MGRSICAKVPVSTSSIASAISATVRRSDAKGRKSLLRIGGIRLEFDRFHERLEVFFLIRDQVCRAGELEEPQIPAVTRGGDGDQHALLRLRVVEFQLDARDLAGQFNVFALDGIGVGDGTKTELTAPAVDIVEE